MLEPKYSLKPLSEIWQQRLLFLVWSGQSYEEKEKLIANFMKVVVQEPRFLSTIFAGNKRSLDN